MLAVDWGAVLNSVAAIVAAVAAIIAAFHSNQASNNTTTPNGEKRTVGEIVTDVAKAIGPPEPKT
jgi:hypothetical protein